jgi:hypothetical protein
MTEKKPGGGARDPGSGPRWSYKGGSIEPAGDTLTSRFREIVRSAPAQKRGVEPKQSEAERLAKQRDAAANALELALSKTEYGRRTLDLLADCAKWRLHEQLATELARCAAEKVDHVRRRLLSTRDPLEQHHTAAALPEAEAELRRWRAALADYQSRRERLEYELRDAMRVFA